MTCSLSAVMSISLTGPCEPSERTQACRQAGDWSSPDPGDSPDRGNAGREGSGEIRNARAVICLAEGDPAGALGAVRDVLDGTAPVLGYVTVVEADLLAGLAYRELGDQRAANQAAERALALAEPDRLILPSAMIGSRELLEALPRHQTAHAALLADILDVLHGSAPAAGDQPPPLDAAE